MQDHCTALHSFVQMYLLILAAIELMLVAHVICIHVNVTIQAHFDTKKLVIFANRGLACVFWNSSTQKPICRLQDDGPRPCSLENMVK